MASPSSYAAKELQAQVQHAFADKTKLDICGNQSKAFYAREINAQTLCTTSHSGVIDYDPTELVITAKAGTRLEIIHYVLQAENQMLAFEPPFFSKRATLGGVIACGFSGPRRPYVGAARDFVLGVNCLNGKGEYLQFGGRVMKNVAGYDVSRLMTGALGTLGVILDVSLKVLPKPETEVTLIQQCGIDDALTNMNKLAVRAWPVSASAYADGNLRVRLSGDEATLHAAQIHIGGEPEHYDKIGTSFWDDLREHQLPFFSQETPLWRCSMAPGSPMPDVHGSWLIDWGGAQRWLKSDVDPDSIRSAIADCGGHATLFRGGDRSGDVFHPLNKVVERWHQGIKQAFDPAGILNPGKMYQTL